MKVELDLPDGVVNALSNLAIHDGGLTFESVVLRVVCAGLKQRGIVPDLDRPYDPLHPERCVDVFPSGKL